MKKSTMLMMACCMAGCMTDETIESESQSPEELELLPTLENPSAVSDESILRKLGDGVIGPAHAICGRSGPNLENFFASDAASPNAANQRSGSSTGCAALGVLQPSDDAIFFCFTNGNDGFKWTYLQNVRTGVRGWARHDVLRPIGGFPGSIVHCGF